MTLEDYVDSLIDKDVEWGVDDCTGFVANWIRINGIDLDLPQYSSELGAARLIRREGSLLALWNKHLSESGISRSEYPSRGDIGIVETQELGQMGLIYYDPFWVRRGTNTVAPFSIPQNQMNETLWCWSLNL